MSNFYTEMELLEFGFKKIGKNVKISRSAKLYQCELMEFGNHIRIDDYCVLSGKLVFGNYIHITCYNLLAGGDEGIIFQDYSTLAYRCTLFTRSDDYSGHTLCNSTIPPEYRFKTIKESIRVGKYAIIGTCSVVFPGAHIAEGVSIGASSTVLNPTKPWGMYVGIPAKRKKDREKSIIQQSLEFERELRDD